MALRLAKKSSKAVCNSVVEAVNQAKLKGGKQVKRIAYLPAVCLALSASIVAAPSSYSQEVFAVPVSDQIIRGEVVLPGGKTIRFGAREGTMVTIRDREKGYFIGFVPKIEDDSSNEVKFRFFTIKEWIEDGKIAQGAYQILEATKVAKPGSQITTNELTLKFSEIVPGEFPGIKLLDPRTAKPLVLEQLYGVTSAGLCCLGCGGVTVCGSEVAGECGSCSGGGYRSV